jgi:hypothetical protein
VAYPSTLDLTYANDALARLAERPIGAFTDNSPAARTVARLYPRVRALLFSGGDWKFATARAALGSASAGVYPWANEYAMPANVARCRIVVRTAVGDDGVDLGPQPFEEGINAGGTARVIRTDVNPAVLIYTAEIIDPALWDAGFVSCFTLQLAAELALPITGNGNIAQEMAAAAQRAIMTQMPTGQAQAVVQAPRGPSTTTQARG